MNATILNEYRRMRQSGVGGIVGQEAMTCLRLAKARAEFLQRDDVEITWTPEQECYEDVYGEKPAEGLSFYHVQVLIGGEHMASLGFVDDSSNDYMRQVENELLSEAFAQERESQEVWDEQERSYNNMIGESLRR